MEIIDDFGKNDLSRADKIEAWLGRIELRSGRINAEIPSKIFKKSLALLAGEMAPGYHPQVMKWCPG